MPNAVTLQQAQEVVEHGEWIWEADLFELLQSESATYAAALMGIPSFVALRLVKEKSSILNALLVELTETAEQRHVIDLRYDANDGVLPHYDLRLREGTILKISPTVDKTKTATLAIIAAVLSMSSWDLHSVLIATAKSAPSLALLLKELRSAFENLTDPKERLAFEMIYILHGKLAVVNFDKFPKHEKHRAYGLLMPNTQQIEEAICGYPFKEAIPSDWQAPVDSWRDDLRSTLDHLAERSVIEERMGQWRIVL
jgi:hypothetical protein